uniref:HpcH/HpaI aldolase family protein n=1 Tax=Marinobacterium profundum TaxID=1714300 RepID=UPI00082F9F8B|nr:aldolase/citrate lyase family protein [Marinobacterium profundum]
MRANQLRTIWQSGGCVINSWLSLPSSFAAETMAHQGWDSLTIDMQHGVIDYQSALQMLTAISTTQTVPIVRVPWLDPGFLMKTLDAGAYAVICPMINNRADAELLVSATSYPPQGTRSYGPIRAFLYGGADYPAQANDTIVRFAMIETREALENLDDILSVEGLDAVYIGPADLSSALGYKPQFDPTEPAVVDAIDHILARAKAHGLIAGIHNGTPEYAQQMIDKGFQFVTIGSDVRMLASGSKQILKHFNPAGNDAPAVY